MRSCSQKGKISNYRRWVQYRGNADGYDETCIITAIRMITLTLCLQIKCHHFSFFFFFFKL